MEGGCTPRPHPIAPLPIPTPSTPLCRPEYRLNPCGVPGCLPGRDGNHIPVCITCDLWFLATRGGHSLWRQPAAASGPYRRLDAGGALPHRDRVPMRVNDHVRI